MRHSRTRYAAMQGKLVKTLANGQWSPLMGALMGCVLGNPALAGRMVDWAATADGHILAMATGDCGYNHYIGPAESMRTNARMLSRAARLTPLQDAMFTSLINDKLRNV